VSETFDEVARGRSAAYAKDAGDEAFLRALNAQLAPLEEELYVDCEIERPFVFVVGLPRSGTTLLSQVLAYGLDAGYISNFTARFWLAPVLGLRLERIVLGSNRPAAFESDYARTADPREIHEFGYFWRHWLRKERFADVVASHEHERTIDWAGLRRTLANVQRELGKSYVGKNMLGAYHMRTLSEALEQVVWVLVERDPLDAAVSILDARRKHYDDPRSWWSYVPLEYDQLAGLDEWEQIAGQVHYLSHMYDQELAALGDAGIRVRYEDLCTDPAAILREVSTRCARLYGREIPIVARPEPFPVRSHDDRTGDKERFAGLLAALADGG
jgi:sulfotransferase family protein